MKRGENIRKRKDGRWEGRYSKGKIDGKPVQGSVFGRTYQEAKEKLIIAKALQAGISLTGEEDEISSLTFGLVAEEWLEASKPALKPSSIARYRNILDNQLLPAFSFRKISEISREDVSSFCSYLLRQGGCRGGGLSPKTVSGVLSVLKLILLYAHQVKEIRVVDLTGISVKQARKQLRIFSVQEQERLSLYLMRDITPVKLGVLLCLYTGLRIGEVCALTWRDISCPEGTIHVNKTMQRIQMPKGHYPRTRVIITSPKSDCSMRIIPVPETILDIVKDMQCQDTCYLLTGQEDVYIEPRAFENHFAGMMADCQIEGVTVHTCRHSFATRCIELGFDMKTLSEILGHASVSITLNRYVHPSMETKQQNMNKLCGLLGVR